MNTHINEPVAVIGGTGRSGKYLVKHLLEKGFQIKMLLRYPEKLDIKSSSIEIIKGDARNPDSIQQLLKGCSALISTLNQPKGETPIFSEATKNIIQSMDLLQDKRYIGVCGLNVDTPFDEKGQQTQLATDWMKSNFTEICADRQQEYELLANSAVNWTLVRLPLIIPTDVDCEIEVSLQDCKSDKINTIPLAKFLVDILENESYVKQAPFVANK
ncbi:NAD(P)-dependent oxidoreductase [Chondrinema litorale]|uniref:NAD(P)-dependent oxidoreductase n=1 Tax=Chondrinema litorale TaxID=2994555 RepID=UPI002542B8D4|nr:NAD(P)H-binding protein [Chondrinema litorale]UZR96112.1 NAD(P)H-binding protein [Chondrinema litorale]